MSEPIRIPVTDPIFPEPMPNSDYITITPDLARQIVALSDFRPAPGTTLLPLPQPVADDAPDSADVLTLLAEMTLERDKFQHQHSCMVAKANYMGRERDQALADLAAANEALRLHQSTGTGCIATLVKERDAARAELEAEREKRDTQEAEYTDANEVIQECNDTLVELGARPGGDGHPVSGINKLADQRDTARERVKVLEGFLDRWLHSGFGIAPPINETKAALAGKDRP